MFVTALEIDNLDYTKINAQFKKFTACLQEGLIYKWKHTVLAPYVGKQLTALFHSYTAMVDICCLQHCSTNGKLRVLVNPQCACTGRITVVC